MKTVSLLDPKQPELSRMVEDALAESLPPLPPAPERAQALRKRLMARVRASADSGRAVIHVPLAEGEWHALVSGVRAKRLDAAQRAFLLELAPGAALPFHRHHEDEECVVLRGSAELGAVTVHAGDYHLARSGSRHGMVRSADGALLYLRGTPIGHGGEVLRDLAGALLPGSGEPLVTRRADAPDWQPLPGGGEARLLREDAVSRSRMVRLAPGAQFEMSAGAAGAECLVVDGEACFPERVMGAGDYRIAPTDGRTEIVSSDCGALLFVRDRPPAGPQ